MQTTLVYSCCININLPTLTVVIYRISNPHQPWTIPVALPGPSLTSTRETAKQLCVWRLERMMADGFSPRLGPFTWMIQMLGWRFFWKTVCNFDVFVLILRYWHAYTYIERYCFLLESRQINSFMVDLFVWMWFICICIYTCLYLPFDVPDGIRNRSTD